MTPKPKRLLHVGSSRRPKKVLSKRYCLASSGAPRVAAEAGSPCQQQRACLQLLRGRLLPGCRRQLQLMAPGCLRPVRQTSQSLTTHRHASLGAELLYKQAHANAPSWMLTRPRMQFQCSVFPKRTCLGTISLQPPEVRALPALPCARPAQSCSRARRGCFSSLAKSPGCSQPWPGSA